jgi:hypothetical protein
MECPGLHCDGCGGGGGALIALVVVIVIIGAAVHAIWHQNVEAVEVVALVLVSAAGLALAAGGVYAAFRIRAHVRGRRTVPIPAQVIRLGAEPEHKAISAPRWPLTGWEDIHTDSNRRNP